jgi:transcriptional regulator with XRE-family HTH domain
MDMVERFGKNLAIQREKAGLSQEELAFRASLHRTAISLSETGKREPRLETLVKLAGALEIPVEDLLDGISWEPIRYVTGGLKVSDP